MMFTESMVDLLIRTNIIYEEYVYVTKRGEKVIYVQLTKAMYDTIRAARLWWENLSGKLLDMEFEFNPYDLCVMTKEINGKQYTVVWHVDDLKVSHLDPEVITGVL